MQKLLILFVAIISCSFKPQNISNEQVIFERIEYIFNLKTKIGNQIWKNFDTKKFDVPLIYYTDSSSYVANPPKKFIQKFQPFFVYGTKNVKIYKTKNRIDNIPFHMETSMSSGDGAENDYNYNSPFMNCSSFEVTSKIVTDTHSTEYWTTMIMHEYFHGFQFKHKAFADNLTANIATVSEDSLKNIYKNENWFSQKVNYENKFLLKAMQATTTIEINNNIDSFFVARKDRRAVTKQKLKFDIDAYEKTYETMEGTARYVEYKLQVLFATLQPDKKLAASDSSFHDYEEFKNYKIENDPWLYTTGKSYFYATGFNIVRLLDKLGIEYKTRLFKDGQLSLEQLLLTRKR